ncbi:hypothetical protein GF402_02695 [Candidatus Fermentibacteria bacterium]|nr:hypothetical protein [Candidatus Fermentibacteria bacterium]
MADDQDKLDRALKQLANSVMNEREAENRPAVAESRLAAQDISDAGELVSRLDNECTSSPDHSLSFLSVLHLGGRKNKDLDLNALTEQLRRKSPSMAESWSRLPNFDESDIPTVMAKVSLVLELYYVLNRELESASMPTVESTGSSLALKVISGMGPNKPVLKFDSSVFSGDTAEVMTEVLEELDFIKKGRNSWEYNLSESAVRRYSFGSNLLSYQTGSRMSPLALSRMAENLVKRLGFIVRSTGMYPPGHPAIQPALTSFMNILNEYHKEEPMTTLSVMGDQLMVNDQEIKRKGKVINSFLRQMSDRNASSISFHAGVDADGVMRFASIFNKSPAYIKKHGGLDKLMERRNIHNVTCDQFRYALVSKDGEVISTTEAPEEKAIENLIFGELIDRLERGESLRDLSSEQLGEAFKKVLDGSAEGITNQRGLLANFIASLDPTILEQGLLARRDIQRDMSWSAVRRIVRARIKDLASTDEDLRLEAVERLMSLTLTAIERNKDNTVQQVIENVGAMLSYEANPEALYSATVLLGTVCGSLISTGKMAAADTTAKALENLRNQDLRSADLTSARRRALEEAMRRMDTPGTGERLLDALMSRNEVVSEEAERLAARLFLKNLVWKLMDVFLEPDRHTRARAYRILCKLGGPAVPVMIARLRRLRSGFETPRDPETGRLSDEDWYISRNIVAILGETKTQSGLEVLEELSRDTDERLRQAVLRSMYMISPEKATEVAIGRIDDPSLDVATVALEILQKSPRSAAGMVSELVRLFKLKEGLRPAIMAVLRRIPDSDEVLRLAVDSFNIEEGLPMGQLDLALDALTYIRKYGDKRLAPVLRRYMKENENPGLLKKRGDEQKVAAEIGKALREL